MPPVQSPYRVFADKSYATDFTSYATKEAATTKINDLKQKHGKLLARVVERKGNFVIYFEESSYKTIFGTLPQKPESAAVAGSRKSAVSPAKTVTKKVEKPAQGSDKPTTTKSTLKLSGPFGSEKPTPKPSPVENVKTTKTPKKASIAPPPEKRGPAPTPVFYGPPPPYLLARMNRDAQKFYLVKDDEFERLPAKQVDKLFEIFNTELLKFDINFEKERPVIGRIKEIQSILTRLKNKIDEEIMGQFLAEKVKASLDNGKFVKILQKYESFNARTVADAIIKELGRSRKECPLSDYALGQEIAKILQEKFPGKYRD